MNPKAAIVIIGDEILSGHTLDSNSGWLAGQLFDLGVLVELIITIPDNKETIIKWISKLSEEYDFVFSTGGIGPTHDDVTRKSIAEAFGLPCVCHPEAERILKDFYGSKITESRLSMAYLPEGVTLIRNPISAAPGFILKNVYVFPGIPELLKLMFSQVIEKFDYSRFKTKVVKTKLPESVYAKKLFLATEKFPDVLIGSYPKIYDPECKTEIVLKSKDEAVLQEAFDYISDFVDELQGDHPK
jgi:molybdenum cofactor synthesis domain-containing protein